MKIFLGSKRNRGMTLAEVLLVVAALFIVLAVWMPRFATQHKRSARIGCINNLKQIGLGFRVWAGDQQGHFPMGISATNGGTKELEAIAAFRLFEVLSNEISTPKILFCPEESDRWRTQANAFASDRRETNTIVYASNTNLSYFVGLDASEIHPQMFLAGDHNLTNGTLAKDGLLVLSTNHPAGWTADMHKFQGNIGLADGSAQTFSTVTLRKAIEDYGPERLAMP